jgi:hypothetical protein
MHGHGVYLDKKGNVTYCMTECGVKTRVVRDQPRSVVDENENENDTGVANACLQENEAANVEPRRASRFKVGSYECKADVAEVSLRESQTGINDMPVGDDPQASPLEVGVEKRMRRECRASAGQSFQGRLK